MTNLKLSEDAGMYYESLSPAEQQLVDAFYNLKKEKQLGVLEKAFKYMLRNGNEDDAKRILALHNRIKETSNGFDFTLDDDVRTVLMAKELVSSLIVPIALDAGKMSRGKSNVIFIPSGGKQK